MTTSDLAETLSLLFCGAEVNCYSGEPTHPSPLHLAEQAGQRLQMEFLLHNKNSGERERGLVLQGRRWGVLLLLLCVCVCGNGARSA